MSAITAKAINSTLGKSNFKALDVLLGAYFQALADEVRTISKRSLVSSDSPYFCLGNGIGKVFEKTMKCSGSMTIKSSNSNSKQPVTVTKNGSVVPSKTATQCVVVFSKGDVISVTVGSGDLSSDVNFHFIYASPVNLEGIGIYE